MLVRTVTQHDLNVAKHFTVKSLTQVPLMVQSNLVGEKKTDCCSPPKTKKHVVQVSGGQSLMAWSKRIYVAEEYPIFIVNNNNT